MDRALEILDAAVDALAKERLDVVHNYRYNWMTTDQKVELVTNLVREIDDIREAISLLENS